MLYRGFQLECSIACSSAEVSVESRKLAQVAQAEIAVPIIAAEANAVVMSGESVSIGDRVELRAGNGAGAIGNSGSGTVLIGTDSKIGHVYSTGSIDIRDRARVTGDVVSQSGISIGNSVTITGQRNIAALGDNQSFVR